MLEECAPLLLPQISRRCLWEVPTQGLEAAGTRKHAASVVVVVGGGHLAIMADSRRGLGFGIMTVSSFPLQAVNGTPSL